MEKANKIAPAANAGPKNREDARLAVANLLAGSIALTIRVARWAGLVLICAALLVRFLVEVPRELPLIWNNFIFFIGAGLFFSGLVTVPLATQCLLIRARYAQRAQEQTSRLNS
jgi:hypothetical protein